MFSFTLKQPLADFYDRFRLLKSPSFGTAFTMLCPYMYLAHYDQVSRPEGRGELKRLGLDPDLVRVSVGTEDTDSLIAAFEEALS